MAERIARSLSAARALSALRLAVLSCAEDRGQGRARTQLCRGGKARWAGRRRQERCGARRGEPRRRGAPRRTGHRPAAAAG
eukprot:scaffold33934_cov65-Phaeocystis_antarctica.AAC.4